MEARLTGKEFRKALEALFDSRADAAAWLECHERTIYRYEIEETNIPPSVVWRVKESLKAGKPL